MYAPRCATLLNASTRIDYAQIVPGVPDIYAVVDEERPRSRPPKMQQVMYTLE